jgi:hypothetical protein
MKLQFAKVFGLAEASDITMIRTGVMLARAGTEARLLVGTSKDGYHMGLQVKADVLWSRAFPTESDFKDAAEELMWRWMEVVCRENGWEMPDRQKRLPDGISTA